MCVRNICNNWWQLGSCCRHRLQADPSTRLRWGQTENVQNPIILVVTIDWLRCTRIRLLEQTKPRYVAFPYFRGKRADDYTEISNDKVTSRRPARKLGTDIQARYQSLDYLIQITNSIMSLVHTQNKPEEQSRDSIQIFSVKKRFLNWQYALYVNVWVWSAWWCSV